MRRDNNSYGGQLPMANKKLIVDGKNYSDIPVWRQSAVLFQDFLYSGCPVQIPFKFLTFNQSSVTIHHIKIFIGMCVNVPFHVWRTTAYGK